MFTQRIWSMLSRPLVILAGLTLYLLSILFWKGGWILLYLGFLAFGWIYWLKAERFVGIMRVVIFTPKIWIPVLLFFAFSLNFEWGWWIWFCVAITGGLAYFLSRNNFAIYIFFLRRHVDASYWILKYPGSYFWSYGLSVLARRKSLYSLYLIIRSYLVELENKAAYPTLRGLIFEYWDVYHRLEMERGAPPAKQDMYKFFQFPLFLEVFLNEELLHFWLEQLRKGILQTETFQLFFEEFIMAMELFIQQPSVLTTDRTWEKKLLLDPDFESKMDIILFEIRTVLPDMEERVHYAHSLSYLVKGIAQNI